MSLVSRGDRPQLLMRHVRECVVPELIRELPARSEILDVGSGGGLPGIPIAIVRDDLQVALVESRARKSAFLERARLRLNVQNLRILAATVESIPSEHPGERWNLVISRALRWTPRMVAVLEEILAPAGAVMRFGSAEGVGPGVRLSRIAGDEDRAIQIWPRETWPGLSGAP
jgi:16S rRNA (guanine527-N7)-methyltransferase